MPHFLGSRSGTLFGAAAPRHRPGPSLPSEVRADKGLNAVEIALDDLVRVSELGAEPWIESECERWITRNRGKLRQRLSPLEVFITRSLLRLSSSSCECEHESVTAITSDCDANHTARHIGPTCQQPADLPLDFSNHMLIPLRQLVHRPLQRLAARTDRRECSVISITARVAQVQSDSEHPFYWSVPCQINLQVRSTAGATASQNHERNRSSALRQVSCRNLACSGRTPLKG